MRSALPQAYPPGVESVTHLNKKTMRNLIFAGLLLASFGCGDGITNPSVSTDACSIIINGSGNSAACRDVNVTNAPPSPTPTPNQAQDCRVDFLAGSGPDFIPVGGEAEYSLTPMQTFVDAQGASQVKEVPAACNQPKEDQVLWESSSASIQITKLHFAAKAKRVGSGVVSLKVSFDGKSKVFQIN